jgi:hypothetical protein
MRMPSPLALLWLAVAVSALPEVLRWWRSSRSVGEVLWAVDTNAPPVDSPLPPARLPAHAMTRIPRARWKPATQRISFAWTMTEVRR